MKQKIGTIIDQEVIKLAKRRAAEEGRPLNDLIQDALISYLNRNVSDPHAREAASLAPMYRPVASKRITASATRASAMG